MAYAELDFRFGWRWLLPSMTGDRIRLYGLAKEEAVFWREALPELEWKDDDGSRADVLLVDGVHCPLQAMPALADIQNAQLVCMVLNRVQARHWRMVLHDVFPQVREYGLLPSGNPRVVVPLSKSHHTITALRLHRPGRWIARLGLTLACVLARFGNFALLRGRVLLIATRSTDFTPNGAVHAGLFEHTDRQPTDYALYLGTPDANRKTVVLPLMDASPSRILKVAATPEARTSLNTEASALSALSQSSLSVFVPRLDGLVSSDAMLTLYQEYRPRRQIGQRKLDAATVAFLGRIALLGRKSMPLSEYLMALPIKAHSSTEINEACRALYQRLQDLAVADLEIWVHRTHGDFAPWNCTWTDQGLFVFDWEESREQGLALGDAFYYAIAPALLVQRNANAAKTLDAALHLANNVAGASGTELDSRVYLALWLLDRVGQANLYDALIVLLERGWR